MTALWKYLTTSTGFLFWKAALLLVTNHPSPNQLVWPSRITTLTTNGSAPWKGPWNVVEPSLEALVTLQNPPPRHFPQISSKNPKNLQFATQEIPIPLEQSSNLSGHHFPRGKKMGSSWDKFALVIFFIEKKSWPRFLCPMWPCLNRCIWRSNRGFEKPSFQLSRNRDPKMSEKDGVILTPHIGNQKQILPNIS